MSTVAEWLSQAEKRLQGADVPEPRQNAEWLVAHVLGLRRLQMLVHGMDRSLSNAEEERAEAGLVRRCGREPLQHIVGTAPFLEWEFEVNRDVLIPRPETEQLALIALRWLEASGVRRRPSESPLNAKESLPPRQLLDMCTGSACLAVALAHGIPESVVDAVDLSPVALEVARRNVVKFGMGERIKLFQGDGFAALPGNADRRYELIVSNPPYIPTGEIPALEPEVRDHDPRMALDGGLDGLNFYRRLAREGREWLRVGGLLCLEFGAGQGGDLRRMFVREGWRGVRFEKDLAEVERILVAMA